MSLLAASIFLPRRSSEVYGTSYDIVLIVAPTLGGCPRIELLPVLFETRNHRLAFLSNHPLCKLDSHIHICCFRPDEHMGRVEQRIRRFVGSSLIDDGLAGETWVEGKERASVGDGVFVE